MYYLIFAPGGHDERVIDGDADDLLDAGRLELVCRFDIAWKEGQSSLSLIQCIVYTIRTQ